MSKEDYRKIGDKNYERFKRFALQLTKDKEKAAELVHDTYLKVYSNLDKFDPKKSDFEAYLAYSIKWVYLIEKRKKNTKKRIKVNHTCFSGLTEKREQYELRAMKADTKLNVLNDLGIEVIKYVRKVIDGRKFSKKSKKASHENLTALLMYRDGVKLKYIKKQLKIKKNIPTLKQTMYNTEKQLIKIISSSPFMDELKLNGYVK